MFEQMKNMKQLAGMLGNLGDLREKAEQMREELSRKTVEAESGAGAVRVEVSGTFEVKNVTLDPTMLAAFVGEGSDEDRQMVEELITSAINAGLQKAQEMVAEETAKLTGGMQLPGMDQLGMG